MKWLSDLVIPPWAKWFGALLAVIAIVYLINAYGQHQFALGETSKNAEWLQVQNTELVKANAKIKQLEAKARADEQAHVIRLSEIDTQYLKDLDHVKADKDHAIAAINAGTLKLRDPAATTSHECGGSNPSQVTASPSHSDEKAGCELSAEASRFLLDLTSEADEVAKQLNACQSVVESDRAQQ